MASFPSLQPYIGVEIPLDQASTLPGLINGHLTAGESLLALVTTVKALPSLTHVGVTDRRLVGFKAADVSRGFPVETELSTVASLETRPSYQQRCFLVAIDNSGDEVDFGDVHAQDAPRLLQIAQDAVAAAKRPQSAPASPSPPSPAPTAPVPPAAGSFPTQPASAIAPSGWRYNPPPTWPAPPPGWVPPPGWQPDTSWPPLPPGWSLWVPDTPATGQPASGPATPQPVAAPVIGGQAQGLPVPPPLPAHPGNGGGRGLFGGRKRADELEAENAQLRQWVTTLNGMEPLQLADMTKRLREETADLQRQTEMARAELHGLRSGILETQELALLQEVGVYEYQHPLADSVAYKAELTRIKDQIKSMARTDRAVLATTNWSVNGSTAEGNRMVRDFSKLMLRAYNAEADNLVRTMRPYKLQSAIDRLDKSASTIARLGKTMDIRIAVDYHRVRVRELQLTTDHLAKVEEEKERIRAERERQREEEKARREYEKEKARLLRERSHVQSALARLEANGDAAGAAELRAKLTEVDSAISDVEGREANTRAGYVYVISNIGAFGDHMVKIGLTRRLDPMDRVRELGDASVPFKFDVHALIFSNDAVTLETQLHQALSEQRINKVNLRREFFNATPAQVRELVQRFAGQHLLEYTETSEALEWRSSRQHTGTHTASPSSP